MAECWDCSEPEDLPPSKYRNLSPDQKRGMAIKRIHKTVLCVLVLSLYVMGCDDHSYIPIRPEIERAKAWFDVNASDMMERRISRNGRSAHYPSVSLDWRKGKLFDVAIGLSIVQVPVKYEQRLVASNDSDGMGNDTRVLTTAIFFEVLPGEYVLYLLRILTEEDSFEISNNAFSFREPPVNFSGSLLFFDWDETFVGGWRIEKGERTHFYTFFGNREGNSLSGRTNELQCYAIDTYWWSQACTPDGDCADPVLIEVITTIVCEQVIAPPSEDPVGGGGGGEPEVCLQEHPYIEGLLIPCEEDGWTLNDLQSQNRLCGAYSFLSVGEGMTAEILGLGATAVRRSTGQMLHVLLGPVCVTFGASTGLVHPSTASTAFNNTWNAAMNDTDAWIKGQTNPTAASLRTYIIQRLRVRLLAQSNEGYFALTIGSCKGNIPSTQAQYCN